jgi:hypothetical protein
VPGYRVVPVLDALPAEPAVLDAQPAEPAVLDPIPVSELVLDPVLVPPIPPRWYEASPPVVVWRLIRFVVVGIALMIEWLFGATVLTIGLAILAALPVLQFLSLGYLLEAGGRVARTGRLRDGFIGVRLAAWLGGVFIVCYLMLLPVRFVSDMASSAHVIDPGGASARNWRLGLMFLIGFTFLMMIVVGYLFVHVAAARARRVPFSITQLWRGGIYAGIRDALWDTVMALRLPYYFWLGLRGFAAAFVWLALPVSLLVLGNLPIPVIAPLIGWFGAFLLAAVLLYLPFLQLRMAEQNRFAAAFEWLEVRADYRRAPWIFSLAFMVTLLSALPLYLLKIEVVPREAAWLPSLFFVAYIFPARLLTGWAVGCARHRPNPSHWFFRWTGRLPQIPIALFYVLILYFTQFTSWNGVWSLYEQHAFLLPVPFFGM